MSTVSRDTMLLTTPFHSRVEAMCDLNDWGNWMGYTTPNAYFDVELEYFAVRSTTGVFDLSPMNKYRISGPDASRYMDRLVTRDVSKIGIDRVGYATWCNDAGQVLDDGTIFHATASVEQMVRVNVTPGRPKWAESGAVGTRLGQQLPTRTYLFTLSLHAEEPGVSLSPGGSWTIDQIVPEDTGRAPQDTDSDVGHG